MVVVTFSIAIIFAVKGAWLILPFAGYGMSREQQSFQRAWATMVHEHPRINGHPSRLLIRSHGRSLEIGACLDESEKAYLARELGYVIRVAN